MLASDPITDADWRAIRRLLRAHAERDFAAGHWAEASDIVQDTLAELPNCPEHIRTGSFEEVVGWLRGVLRHKAADARRRQLRTKRLVTTARTNPRSVDEPADRGPSASWVAEENEEKAALRAAVANLPPGQREIVSRMLDGWTEAEVARQLNVTRQTVSAGLAAAKRKLRKLLPPPRSDRAGRLTEGWSWRLTPHSRALRRRPCRPGRGAASRRCGYCSGRCCWSRPG